MRRVGGAGRQVVPGVRQALIARLGRLDSAFCGGPACSWCADARTLRAGERLAVPGEVIWSAMFDDRHPDAWERFLHDSSLYVVVGPDTIEPAA